MIIGSIEEAFFRDRCEAPPLTEPEIVQHQEYLNQWKAENLKREQELELDRQKLASIAEQFDVVSAYKIVISGMSSRSSGNGTRRNSVVHGLTLKPLRLKHTGRIANEFLCKAGSGSHGYIVQPLDHVDCPKCMDFIDRYALKVCTDAVAKKLSQHY